MNGRRESRWKDGLPLVNLSLFTLVAIALVGSVVLIFNTVETERGQREQVRRTSEILLQLNNIGRAAINAETGQRGYFITLDRRYLEPYHYAREQYRPAIAQLKQLVGSGADPRQAQLLAEIEQLSEAKFADMEQSVAQIERGELISAQRQILTDRGQNTMMRLRHALTEMQRIEYRILRQATDNAAAVEARVFPLLGALLFMLLAALALGYWQVSRAARAAAIEAHAEELAQANDRAELLTRELNHRVKNLFAVILAIVRMSGRSDPAAQPVVESIAQRIHALLTAHEVTQGAIGHQQADLRQLVETTLAPHHGTEAGLEIDGPAISLPAVQVTPLGLVLHELTTNAVKYGAWAHGGRLEVKWSIADGAIHIAWSEHCPNGCAPAEGRGFGSQLIDSAARQLQGKIERDFAEDGVRVRITIPLSGQG